MEFNLDKLQDYSPFCFSCLGRAFGLVGFGIDNRERGREILNQIELSTNKELESEFICSSSDCRICDGLISEIGDFVDIWTNVVIKEGIKIGNNAVIGSCSFVDVDVPDNSHFISEHKKIIHDFKKK